MERRIVQFKVSTNTAIGVYNTIQEASKESGISIHDIDKCLRGAWPDVKGKNTTFKYEVTNAELREASRKKKEEKLRAQMEKLKVEWKN